jgi:hypothetical protein
LYRPVNPEKYIGDPCGIIYRSSWEKKFLRWLDASPAVKRWASEELAIPYASPVDGKIHKYYPDFYIEMVDNGQVKKFIAEIKPAAQCAVTPGMSARSQLEVAVNHAKWAAAKLAAEANGAEFKVLTEKVLF